MISKDYMHIFGWLILAINSFIIILLFGLGIKHIRRAINRASVADINFHFIMFVITVFFFMGNVIALYRQVVAFLIVPVQINISIAELTLLDRTCMMGTAIMIWMLGNKYKTDWYS